MIISASITISAMIWFAAEKDFSYLEYILTKWRIFWRNLLDASRKISISHVYQRWIYRSFQVHSQISNHQPIRCCFYGEFCGTSYDSFHRRIIVSQLAADCFCSENLAIHFGNLLRWYTDRTRCKIWNQGLWLYGQPIVIINNIPYARNWHCMKHFTKMYL